jgi:hypothetical protein
VFLRVLKEGLEGLKKVLYYIYPRMKYLSQNFKSFAQNVQNFEPKGTNFYSEWENESFVEKNSP